MIKEGSQIGGRRVLATVPGAPPVNLAMLVANACFGGPGLRTLYVTLSGTGQLIAIDDWPTPGLKRHFQA